MTLIQRDAEITGLYDLVMARESIFLHAPSGMGKTHIIKSLYQKLEGRRICFYVSLSGMQNNRSYAQALETSVRQTSARYSNVEYQLRRFFEDHSIPAEDSMELINKWLEHLLVSLQNISQDFLFILEDLDEWEGEEAPAELFRHFFGARNSQLLLTANYYDESLASQAQRFELKPLQKTNFPAEAQADNEKTIAKVLQYTRGNTAFVLDLLQQESLDNVKLKKSANRVMSLYHPMFYSFRLRFTDLQWRLLKAIASERVVPQPHSFEFLMNYRLGAASSVERALKNLADTRMIVKAVEGWHLENVILQRWLEWMYALRDKPQNSIADAKDLIAG